MAMNSMALAAEKTWNFSLIAVRRIISCATLAFADYVFNISSHVGAVKFAT